MDGGVVSGMVPYVSRIDLSRYDRSPLLTADELQTARRWVAAEGVVITRNQLPRLYAPLADVLLHDGADRMNRLRAIRYVLTEVGRSGQAYWGWDERRWLDLIDQRQALSKVSMMPQLTALAYMLCGVKGFYELKRNITLAPTARLVFGCDQFDPECERVIASWSGSVSSVPPFGRSCPPSSRRWHWRVETPGWSASTMRCWNVLAASTTSNGSANGLSCWPMASQRLASPQT